MAPRASKPATSRFQFRLDMRTGVPVYRQLIDQVLLAMASGVLQAGDQLPTVRQVAVDLAINPNTVARAYREMEIREILTTQQGSGTFISGKEVSFDEARRRERLDQMMSALVSQAAADGFQVKELQDWLREFAEGEKEER